MKALFTHLLALLLVLSIPVYPRAQVIADGGRHSLLICADSTVRAWGYNGYGQLGNGTIMEQHTGVPVSGLDGVVRIAGGLFHSLFVKKDGSVWACGRNTLGPLGDGTTMDRTTPVQVGGLTNVVQAAGGGEHSLFLQSDSTVWACGNNTSGQLGDGTNITKLTPVQVAALTNIVQVAAGAEYSLFLKNDGTVWACGHNGFGQFGNGTNTSSKVPVLISGLSGIIHISAGEWHSIFVKNDGTVYSCGRNQFGQLGDGTLVNKNTPVQINALSEMVQADAGGIHSVFVKKDGTAYACGLNSGGNNDGQLGDGTTIDRTTPVQVVPAWGAVKIVYAVATREHSLFLTKDGAIWASGRNNYGQLGSGVFSGINSSISIQTKAVCSLLPVSISNPERRKFSFSLSPNPATTELALHTDFAMEGASFVLYNAVGQLARRVDQLYGQDATIPLDGLPNGIYFARLLQYTAFSAVQILVISKP